ASTPPIATPAPTAVFFSPPHSLPPRPELAFAPTPPSSFSRFFPNPLVVGTTWIWALPRLYAIRPPIHLHGDQPRLHPVVAQPFRHLSDRQGIAAVALYIARARNRLRLLALTASRLIETERRVIGNHRQQIVSHRP